MLKYPVRGKIVNVHGEEEYMISHLNSLRYVEMDGEFIETPFQNFEEVPQIMDIAETTDSPLKVTKSPLKMASLKDARPVVEEGGSTIWVSSWLFITSITNLVWSLLHVLKGLFVVLGLEDLPYAPAILGSMQLKTMMVIPTLTVGATPLPAMDSVTGLPID